MLRKMSIQAAVIVSMLCIFLAAAGPSYAYTIASTDFGTTEGNDASLLSPFSTDHGPMPNSPPPEPQGTFYIAKSAAGHIWSAGDWGGYDHTSTDHTGCFMVVNGAGDSNTRIVYYTTITQAGQQYTFSGWAMNVLSGNGGPPTISFRVNGDQKDSFYLDPSKVPAQTWAEFTFTYIAQATGSATFSLNDNNTSGGANDFGLDDLQLTGPNPVPLPPAILLLGSGLLSLGGISCWRRRRS